MRVFKLVSAMIWAIPVYFIWNYLAPIYLSEAPPLYLNIPYWHIACLFMLIQIVKMMILPSKRSMKHHGLRHHYGRYFKYGHCDRGFWTEKYRHQS